jgi:hypothetical protein
MVDIMLTKKFNLLLLTIFMGFASLQLPVFAAEKGKQAADLLDAASNTVLNTSAVDPLLLSIFSSLLGRPQTADDLIKSLKKLCTIGATSKNFNRILHPCEIGKLINTNGVAENIIREALDLAKNADIPKLITILEYAYAQHENFYILIKMYPCEIVIAEHTARKIDRNIRFGVFQDSLLHAAAFSNNVDTVRFFINKYPGLVYTLNKTVRTPLIEALLHSTNPAVINELQRYTPPSFKSDLYEEHFLKAMRLCTYKKNVDYAKLLINNIPKEYPNRKYLINQSLDYCMDTQAYDIVRLLFETREINKEDAEKCLQRCINTYAGDRQKKMPKLILEYALLYNKAPSQPTSQQQQTNASPPYMLQEPESSSSEENNVSVNRSSQQLPCSQILAQWKRYAFVTVCVAAAAGLAYWWFNNRIH